MIDYVALLLINMVSALVALAFFLWWGLGREGQRDWAPVFGICGLVATVGGFTMAFTWPVPAPYSEIYGQMSVLLGVLFLGAAWTLTRGGSLLPLSIYAFFSGAAALVIGIRFLHLSLTPAPLLPGLGFILTGLGGVGAGAALWWRDRKGILLAGSLILLAAAAIWAFTAYSAYWLHMNVKKTSEAASFRTDAPALPRESAGKDRGRTLPASDEGRPDRTPAEALADGEWSESRQRFPRLRLGPPPSGRSKSADHGPRLRQRQDGRHEAQR